LKQPAINGKGSPGLQDTREKADRNHVLAMLEESERKHMLAVLEETHWLVSGPHGAAARLGMKRSTLQYRMAKLGIARAPQSARKASTP
jgi:formate hydrogenlyase transcriptional activator